MPHEEFPNPIEETSRWIARNRPDAAVHFDRIIGEKPLEFLVALSFAAGKAYGERKNEPAPTCYHHWHCDPEFAAHDCWDVSRLAPCPRCGEKPWR